MAVPQGAVAGLLDPQQRSGWQLAQQVWQDSGVTWERADAEPSGAGFPAAGLAEAAAAGLQPPAADSDRLWFEDAEPIGPRLAGPAVAGREPAAPESARAWLDDPDPIGLEFAGPAVADREPAAPEAARAWLDDADRADPEPVGLQPAATTTARAWPDDADAVDSESVDPEPGDREPARTESAGTWFDGPGPADPRLAARRPGRDRPTVVELTRPSFADSGVIPPEPEFPAAAIHRQPTFTPADKSRLPLRDRDRDRGWPGSARDDDARRPPRSAPARPDQRRPEPERYPASDDWIQFGSDRAGPGRRPGPDRNEYPASGSAGQAWPAGSGQVPLSAPVMVGSAAPGAVGSARFPGAALPPRAAGAPPLSEPDELFRAWQGSVREAAAPRRPWPSSRPGTPSRRRRAVQAATIGVPAAIIVTVGAGALLMLTGKANEMLAPRSDTGATSPAAPAASASLPPSGKAVPAAFAGATLAGYPGQRGPVTVDSMQLVGGTALAVGTADGHPAIWRRAANGTWTLESAATLGAVAGRATLSAAAWGQAGWLAVGSVSAGGTMQPLVFASADGVTWQPVAGLAALAGKGTQFLGIAAGHGGYVVVGRQMAGGRIFAVLWYSADLRSWTMESNGGLDGRLAASTVNAVAATAAGFVGVGSHGATQAIWTSPDGKRWNLVTMSLPSGVHSATLTSIAASGGRAVAAGYADTAAGDVPLVVATVDGGAQWRQVSLPAPGGLGVITALTATPNGFTAAGRAGSGTSARTVTWTSKDGLTWSQPTQTADSKITALTAVGTEVYGTAERDATPSVVTVPAP